VPVFEVADDELDDGVLAVLGLDELDRSVRLVANGSAPSWAAARLGAQRADAADDEALIAEGGLGDLGDARRRVVVQRVPGGL